MGSEAVSQLSEAAQQATRQARQAASSLASQANEQVRQLAEQQVSAGADLVADVAEAVRAAADDLEERIPPLGQLARSAATRLEDVSDSIRDQSAAELFQMTADFARRRPAVLFGATAAIGFLIYRLATAAAPDQDHDEFDEGDWEDWEDEDEQTGGQLGGGSAPPGSGGGQFHGA